MSIPTPVRTIFRSARTLAATAALTTAAFAHGGVATYPGPGDTVPAGGGRMPGGGGPAPTGPSTSPAGPTRPGFVGAPTGGNPVAGAAVAAQSNRPQDAPPDLTKWTFWWEFNSAPYLNLKAHIHSATVGTGSDGWFLGHGQKRGHDSLRPSEEQIRQKIVPALLEALDGESHNDIVTACLIGLAKIGDAAGTPEGGGFEPILRKRLSDPVQEIRETACLALGVLGSDSAIPALEALLMDRPEAHAWVGGDSVDYRTRSFAAYGLALLGHRTQSEELRQGIVRALAEALRTDETRTYDVKVACVNALGLVPLETITSAAEAKDAAPESSRDAQIAFLLGYLRDERNLPLARAHAPIALARLVADLPAGSYVVWKERVAADLLARVGKHSNEDPKLEQSVVLALGILGDADDDDLDQEIRSALCDLRTNVNDQLARNFAMIALAKVGGKPGDGSGEGTSEVSDFLIKQVVDGRTATRPWAGMALGVLGRSLADAGLTNAATTEMSKVLRVALTEEKNPSHLGAYAIGLGILRDVEAGEALVEKLDRVSDDQARGFVAVGLGLMNADAAIAPIQAIVRESKYRPELLSQSAVSLGLLGDKDVVPQLVGMLSEANGLATQAAVASALGIIGDQRSIDPLTEMLQSDDLTKSARAFAAVALGIVGDKDPLPWHSTIGVDLNYRAVPETLFDPQGAGILNIL